MTVSARRSGLAVVSLGMVAAAVLGPAVSSDAVASSSQVYVIQGVPGASFDISVDGETVGTAVEPKEIVGPLDLAPGQHEIEFNSDSVSLGQSFDVSHPSVDVIVHWPADAAEDPEITVFDNDVKPIAAGKGRLTVAHTAVVPPADILAGGEVLFSNIANGEFVTAEVPADTYSVSVVPTGETSDALLGPVDLPVAAGALTRVFAIGEPTDNSMDAVVQVLPLAKGGSDAPGSVDAGEAGLAATNQPSSATDALVPVALLGGALSIGLVVALARRRVRA